MHDATRLALAAAVLAGGLALAPAGALAQAGGNQGSPIPRDEGWATQFLDRQGDAWRRDGGGDRSRQAMRDDQDRQAREAYLRRQFERGYLRGRQDERSRADGQRGDGQQDAMRGRPHHGMAGGYGPGGPPHHGARHAEGPGAGFGPRWDAAGQSQALNWLEAAADRLREALVAMRREPPGEARDRAIDQARQALLRTQNAYTWLPRQEDEGRRQGS